MKLERTQLSYLDLAAFYEYARNCFSLWQNGDATSQVIRELAVKLQCLIDAIRNDGLDPRWNPERDACVGAMVRGSMRVGNIDTADYVVKVEEAGARDIIAHLHKRGYKIIKDVGEGK